MHRLGAFALGLLIATGAGGNAAGIKVFILKPALKFRPRFRARA